MLVESPQGYQNLCRLITLTKLRAKKEESTSRIEELEEHASGLICLTGGEDGPLAEALMRGGYDEGLRTVERMLRIFDPQNVYVELQRHFDRREEARNQAAAVATAGGRTLGELLYASVDVNQANVMPVYAQATMARSAAPMATPPPMFSGSSFSPNAPLVCSKSMPARAVMSRK